MFNLALVNTMGLFDQDALQHFNRMSDTSDGTLLGDLNRLIIGLKTSNVWDKLDDVCVHHSNAADSLLGLKNNFDSTEVLSGAATSLWAIGAGFKVWNVIGGDNIHINTNINTTVSSQLADDDASAFIFKTGSASSPLTLMGAGTGSAPFDDMIVNQGSYFICGNNMTGGIGGADVSVTPPANTGFIGGTRTASNAVEVRHDASNNTAATASTGGAPTLDIFAGSANLSGGSFLLTDGQYNVVSGWGVGSGLSSVELSNLRDAIQTFMTARGL